ncbi:hypothetical protein PFISCL1PPCAC_16956, partial [Pristionchus fissidentatus]
SLSRSLSLPFSLSLSHISVMATLEFGKGSEIDKNFWPQQASDGTVFYVQLGNSSAISVLYTGQRLTAIKSWD